MSSDFPSDWEAAEELSKLERLAAGGDIEDPMPFSMSTTDLPDPTYDWNGAAANFDGSGTCANGSKSGSPDDIPIQERAIADESGMMNNSIMNESAVEVPDTNISFKASVTPPPAEPTTATQHLQPVSDQGIPFLGDSKEIGQPTQTAQSEYFNHQYGEDGYLYFQNAKGDWFYQGTGGRIFPWTQASEEPISLPNEATDTGSRDVSDEAIKTDVIEMSGNPNVDEKSNDTNLPSAPLGDTTAAAGVPDLKAVVASDVAEPISVPIVSDTPVIPASAADVVDAKRAAAIEVGSLPAVSASEQELLPKVSASADAPSAEINQSQAWNQAQAAMQQQQPTATPQGSQQQSAPTTAAQQQPQQQSFPSHFPPGMGMAQPPPFFGAPPFAPPFGFPGFPPPFDPFGYGFGFPPPGPAPPPGFYGAADSGGFDSKSNQQGQQQSGSSKKKKSKMKTDQIDLPAEPPPLPQYGPAKPLGDFKDFTPAIDKPAEENYQLPEETKAATKSMLSRQLKTFASMKTKIVVKKPLALPTLPPEPKTDSSAVASGIIGPIKSDRSSTTTVVSPKLPPLPESSKSAAAAFDILPSVTTTTVSSTASASRKESLAEASQKKTAERRRSSTPPEDHKRRRRSSRSRSPDSSERYARRHRRDDKNGASSRRRSSRTRSRSFSRERERRTDRYERDRDKERDVRQRRDKRSRSRSLSSPRRGGNNAAAKPGRGRRRSDEELSDRASERRLSRQRERSESSASSPDVRRRDERSDLKKPAAVAAKKEVPAEEVVLPTSRKVLPALHETEKQHGKQQKQAKAAENASNDYSPTRPTEAELDEAAEAPSKFFVKRIPDLEESSADEAEEVEWPVKIVFSTATIPAISFSCKPQLFDSYMQIVQSTPQSRKKASLEEPKLSDEMPRHQVVLPTKEEHKATAPPPPPIEPPVEQGHAKEKKSEKKKHKSFAKEQANSLAAVKDVPAEDLERLRLEALHSMEEAQKLLATVDALKTTKAAKQQQAQLDDSMDISDGESVSAPEESPPQRPSNRKSRRDESIDEKAAKKKQPRTTESKDAKRSLSSKAAKKSAKEEESDEEDSESVDEEKPARSSKKAKKKRSHRQSSSSKRSKHSDGKKKRKDKKNKKESKRAKHKDLSEDEDSEDEALGRKQSKQVVSSKREMSSDENLSVEHSDDDYAKPKKYQTGKDQKAAAKSAFAASGSAPASKSSKKAKRPRSPSSDEERLRRNAPAEEIPNLNDEEDLSDEDKAPAKQAKKRAKKHKEKEKRSKRKRKQRSPTPESDSPSDKKRRRRDTSDSSSEDEGGNVASRRRKGGEKRSRDHQPPRERKTSFHSSDSGKSNRGSRRKGGGGGKKAAGLQLAQENGEVPKCPVGVLVEQQHDSNHVFVQPQLAAKVSLGLPETKDRNQYVREYLERSADDATGPVSATKSAVKLLPKNIAIDEVIPDPPLTEANLSGIESQAVSASNLLQFEYEMFENELFSSSATAATFTAMADPTPPGFVAAVNDKAIGTQQEKIPLTPVPPPASQNHDSASSNAVKSNNEEDVVHALEAKAGSDASFLNIINQLKIKLGLTNDSESESTQTQSPVKDPIGGRRTLAETEAGAARGHHRHHQSSSSSRKRSDKKSTESNLRCSEHTPTLPDLPLPAYCFDNNMQQPPPAPPKATESSRLAGGFEDRRGRKSFGAEGLSDSADDMSPPPPPPPKRPQSQTVEDPKQHNSAEFFRSSNNAFDVNSVMQYPSVPQQYFVTVATYRPLLNHLPQQPPMFGGLTPATAIFPQIPMLPPFTSAQPGVTYK